MAIDLERGHEWLLEHVGHEFECVTYGATSIRPTGMERVVWNVSLECMTCGCVVLDFDAPEVGLWPGV
jgi:hypothetical protein